MQITTRVLVPELPPAVDRKRGDPGYEGRKSPRNPGSAELLDARFDRSGEVTFAYVLPRTRSLLVVDTPIL